MADQTVRRQTSPDAVGVPSTLAVVGCRILVARSRGERERSGGARMATVVKKAQPADTKRTEPAVATPYVFKSASELPRSKPDYVVQSPTPLGQRPVPQPKRND
jgi:hypothetical protein